MIAKEKAIKLVERYYNLQHKTIICSEGYAKECAKICVDEIIKSKSKPNTNYTIEVLEDNTIEVLEDIQYWKDVLTEIDKL